MRIICIYIELTFIIVINLLISGKVNAQYPTPGCSGSNPESTWTNKDAGSFNVSATGVTDATAVKFQTYFSPPDQQTYLGSNMGGGTWTATVTLANHPGQGVLTSNILMDNTWYTNIVCNYPITFTRDSIAPTCTTSGSTTAVLGNSESYTGTGSDTNLNGVDIYYSPTGAESWTAVCSNRAPPYNCSGNINFPTTGTYYVSCNAFDSATNQCTGNPFGIPGGWSFCGAGSTTTVTVITPSPTPTPTNTPTPTIYKAYGWIYKETNDIVVQSEEGSPAEPLFSGLTIDLNIQPITPAPTVYISSQVSSGSPVGGLNANYVFDPIDSGFYSVYLPVTPAGYQLYNNGAERFTNPQIISVVNQDFVVNFPFVTAFPTGPGPIPTNTPSVTPQPTRTPTPSGPTPTGPTITPTRPVTSPTPTPLIPTPSTCVLLPTPDIQSPGWDICTNSVTQFSASVANPNNDSAWALFYSNMYPFAGMGTVQSPPGYGNSVWNVPNNMINQSGTYWWSVFTESPTCPRSKDASAVPINFDFTGPPKPSVPTCTFVSQSISGSGADGKCRFSCSWTQNLESNGTCANTTYYQPVFWTNSADAPYYPTPAWRIFTQQPVDVYISDGYEMSTQIQDADNVNPTPGAGNLSEPSNVGGPYVCPKVIYPPTVTPGGATSTPGPTATPTISPTPTITPTPTPGNWMQVWGGDVYKKTVIDPLPNAGLYFLNDINPNDNSVGVVYSANNLNLGFGTVSVKSWQQIDANGLSNQYNFDYFWEAFKDTATPMTGNNVGEIYYPNTNIYSYEGALLNLAPSFSVPSSLKTAIFLIKGSLIIDSNIIIDSDQSVVFIVLGGIQVASNVTQIDGVYISSSTFSVTYSSNNLLINGMIYAKDMMLNRNNPSFVNPVYRIIYQPKYMFTLLPYLARQKVSFMEVAP